MATERGLLRKHRTVGQRRPQYQSPLLPPHPHPLASKTTSPEAGGGGRLAAGRRWRASPPGHRSLSKRTARVGGRRLGRSVRPELRVTRGPQSEREGARVTVNLNLRAARPRGARPEGSRVSGEPRQPGRDSTPHRSGARAAWGYRGRQAEKLDAKQTGSPPPPPSPPPRSQTRWNASRVPHRPPGHPAEAPAEPSEPRRVITSPGGGVGGGSGSSTLSLTFRRSRVSLCAPAGAVTCYL